MLSFDVFEHMKDCEIETLLRATLDIPDVLVNISRDRRTPGHVNIKSDKDWSVFFERNGLLVDTDRTEKLRCSYEKSRPGCPDLWNRNMFVLSRKSR